MEEIPLSEYGGASSSPSPVNRMMAAFAADFRDGVDVNLGVGYVNERTIPHERIAEAFGNVLAAPEKYRLPLNYGGPKGSPNLIGSIRRFLVEHSPGGSTKEVLDRCEIVIGPSGATSLLEGVGHLLRPGIVITSDPMYYIFCDYLERRGFELVAIPEDDDGIRTDLVEAKLAALGQRKGGISFFYVVTINNPTCTILSNERRRRLVEIATRLSGEIGRKVPVFLDKAYEGLVHDPAVGPIESALTYDDAGVVYEIGTLSKILAPALRVGYMIGRASSFVDAMIQKSSDVGFSAPLVTQEIASYMLDHHDAEQGELVNRGYREKARAVAGWIEEYLGKFLAGRTGGRAGFYFYLTFAEVDTREGGRFFRFLSRTTGDAGIDGPAGSPGPRVIYLPGSFCVHPRGDMVELGNRQLRLSYGFEELDRIHAAIAMMRDAAEYAMRAT